MNITRKAIAFTAMTAAVAVGALTPVASASAEPKPKESGWVAITVDQSSDTVTPMTVVNVGGGTWSYGTYVDGGGWKHCYSQYVHNTKYHSATAIIANGNNKVYANAGYWANADAKAGLAYTCYAYWSTY
jgi:lactococcin 972 family bacteriocin